VVDSEQFREGGVHVGSLVQTAEFGSVGRRRGRSRFGAAVPFPLEQIETPGLDGTEARVRLVNWGHRAALVASDGTLVDVERASGGRFPSDPMTAILRWSELSELSEPWIAEGGGAVVDPVELGPCVPRPSKVFGIGLNYREHAVETGLALPERPLIFAKFPSCLTGPAATVELRGDTVDWEVELVVVIGPGGRDIPAESARRHIAGYCVGQDLSDRTVQNAGQRPQFTMGKSFDGYGPIGPALVSAAAVEHPEDLSIWCELNGERVQDARTSDLLFGVPELVERISSVCTLVPGDLIFTGTPSGVGLGRTPPRFLAPGDVLVSGIEGIGQITTRFTAG
jgi:2-keto-4-pentenoate hydratase/2-oxohepta-3-ene-1,7-dioic acid hydratase in catechol pathway